MKNRHMVVALLLLLSLALCMGAAAETADCEHVWVPYDVELHGVAQDEIRLIEVNETHHAYMYDRPEKVCALCGERMNESGGGEAGYHPHSYTVSQWALDDAQGTVEITLACGVCAYTHTAVLDLQTILDGTADSCLYGGECDKIQLADLYENGMILFSASPDDLPWGFEPGEKIVYEALIYDPVEKTFLVGVRTHCALCGRPWNRAYPTFTPQADFDVKYNGWPIMTEEFFLTDGVPDKLPYQLMDALRSQAAPTP